MRFRPVILTVAMLALCSAGALHATSHEGHMPDLPRTTAPDGAVVYIVKSVSNRIVSASVSPRPSTNA